MRTMTGGLLLLALTLVAARADARDPGLKLDQVVLVMRHGVRPPTKDPALPAGVAAQAWPRWPVKPGWLTPHGAEALRRLAAADRAQWVAAGLLRASGCSATIRVVADSDERTIATGEVYGAAIAGGCDVRTEHQPQDTPDPLFSPIEESAVDYDAAAANRAVLAELGPGGVAAAEARLRPVLDRLDAILCGAQTTGCGLSREPAGLAPPAPGKKPKLTGRLDRGSTAAQVLLLEYAEGKPMAEVGWGRATRDDIAAASALHAAEFALLARPAYMASRNSAPIVATIRATMSGADGAAVTMISGHDTNVASLAGLLGLHWRVPGLAADDPAPGGALVFERLHDGQGRRYVRASYRSQTLEQIRDVTALEAAAPYRASLPLPGCVARGVSGLCTAAQFDALLKNRAAPLAQAAATR